MTCPQCGHGMRTMEVETGWTPAGTSGWHYRAGHIHRRLITTCLNHLCHQEPIDLGPVNDPDSKLLSNAPLTERQVRQGRAIAKRRGLEKS